MTKEIVGVKYSSKRNTKKLSIVCLLIIVPAILSCSPPSTRGSYFIYGLQWGMTVQEVTELLKVGPLVKSKSPEGEIVAEAPFFVAGVSGMLYLKFKKPFAWKPCLKGIKYTAEIRDPSIRVESFNVIMADLEPQLGKPTEIMGTVEADPSATNDTPEAAVETPQSYSAIWRNRSGDIIVVMDPQSNHLIINANADTTDPALKWLE